MRTIDLKVTRYDWVPGVSGLTTPAAPKLTELTAGTVKNISPFLLPATDVNPADSDKASERSITDGANAQVPTTGNYSGKLVGFRDMASGVPTADDLIAIFGAAGVFGWLVRRIGLAWDTAYAVGQTADVFLFCSDNPQKSGGGDGTGFLKATIPLLPQGSMYLDATLVA